LVIGQIEYLNLLPFYIFIKRNKYKVIFKKGYPSQINNLFYQKKVDSAFISSIKSKNKTCLNAGIVANKKVLSVLVCENRNKLDIESDTSNILSKVLNIKGEVLIGDKALKRYFTNNNCKDLASIWFEKYKLPFVFARFCINKNDKLYKKIITEFLKTKVKIPHYIIEKEAKRLGISNKDVINYLKLIYYKIDYKEQKSLKLFLKLSKKV
jgi:chorismate dehydratase